MEPRKNWVRLDEPRRLMVLDSEPKRPFDEVAQRLGAALGAPFAMVNLLDEDRDWFKARVGLPMCEGSAQNQCATFF